MPALQRLAVLVLCINIFMYLGVGYSIGSGVTDETAIKIPGDALDLMLENSDSLGENLDAYSDSVGTGNETIQNDLNLSTEFSSMPSKKGGTDTDPSAGGLSFLDMPKVLWSAFATLMNLLILPITLFTMSGMPIILGVLLGLPFALLNFITIIVFMRGGGAS